MFLPQRLENSTLIQSCMYGNSELKFDAIRGILRLLHFFHASPALAIEVGNCDVRHKSWMYGNCLKLKLIHSIGDREQWIQFDNISLISLELVCHFVRWWWYYVYYCEPHHLLVYARFICLWPNYLLGCHIITYLTVANVRDVPVPTLRRIPILKFRLVPIPIVRYFTSVAFYVIYIFQNTRWCMCSIGYAIFCLSITTLNFLPMLSIKWKYERYLNNAQIIKWLHTRTARL